jgi:hypothetical protein
MPISFNTLLREEGLPLDQVRLLRHMDKRADKGRTPFELWRYNRAAFEIYQSHQGFVHRPRFGDAAYWASFVGLPDNETMFVGLYNVRSHMVLDKDVARPHMDGVDQAGTCDVYTIDCDKRLSEFDGKLFVEWGLGTRSWIQRADLQNKVITELRRKFAEPEFPGFSAFLTVLSKIDTLPPSWVNVLRASRGIYLLTCPRTQEQYVGKADGENGFLGRWDAYVQTGHGGNEGLKSRDPSDYQVSILEVAGSAASADDISKMETLWKKKLQSREMGLNRN